MRVCDAFNVYLHTNTTRLSQWSIYIRVGSILAYIPNTEKHVPHTFRTHSRLEIVWDQTYMRLWWLGIKHIHVHCFLSPDTYAFVWFFVILHPNTYAFVTKPYISPRKVQSQPGNPWDAYCSQKSAYCSLCPFTGMPEATSYQIFNQKFNLFDLTLRRPKRLPLRLPQKVWETLPSCKKRPLWRTRVKNACKSIKILPIFPQDPWTKKKLQKVNLCNFLLSCLRPNP